MRRSTLDDRTTSSEINEPDTTPPPVTQMCLTYGSGSSVVLKVKLAWLISREANLKPKTDHATLFRYAIYISLPSRVRTLADHPSTGATCEYHVHK